jgi:hypothetical protein
MTEEHETREIEFTFGAFLFQLHNSRRSPETHVDGQTQ